MKTACRDKLCAAARSQADRGCIGGVAACGVAIAKLAVAVDSPATKAAVGKYRAGMAVTRSDLNDIQPRRERDGSRSAAWA